MKLQKLLKNLHLLVPFKGEDLEITSIENDNRKVQKGSLFICIKGYTVDGHDFAESAVKNGAAAILAERPLSLDVPVILVKDTTRAMAVLADTLYGQPTKKLHLIGITGTNGKTTTSHLIEKIMVDAGQKTGLIGTMYTKIAEKTIETKNTTPESLILQKTFQQMVEAGVTTAVMEVSSHALDLGRVHGCDYDVAVFTNLTQDHLDYHKTMDEYKRAKSLLFAQLGNTFDHHKPKFAVLNADDPASDMYSRSTAAHVITYGIDNKADIQAKNIQMTSSGTHFNLFVETEKFPIQMQLIGKFSVYNVLASIAASLVSGVEINEIIKSIESVEGVSGRFELVNAGQDFTVIVDYAHTPDSLENVLKTVQHFAKKRIFVIVGCGGDRDRTKRPLMAQIACQLATDPILTSDNPRSEDPLAILKEMEAGVEGEKYKIIPDRKEAIHTAIQQATTGDVILIAGKGHETYQIIGNVVHDFDDRLVAREAIEGR
ncbi:UDP-N-acetylmuramoyl-L-alanyl-D-glutamate--2,6-diaminopimelate ligase [Bacillus sp. ISL-40]|uniref:UDP-N-acetylmuramoyl-L-alanyl-D-glutamate--2, 6-diaminopimelate ligase n=1 Tax=unclassified Bacillus (in: firmicutes) TaxID=185979 RepID=UPI001BEC6BF2|nr:MULTISPECIES: UDP-N-acetylmuramoyl-L-alanyl-D-glutamate--2,6-diaminopimelate ligase [unclassified Bacillus (in: firmicutes)]MBT2697731.1 UDP-N-acetylmuramoyl-L-alanyl-D-glutamate--2,6-diaminopimelate ligase [Bacillus sp. ISL-40]MBT2742371.1 UDP-N-acetylmuramoyl-L-alanyl-D-glutamate--2,6-diaminopimelate ligase [Bacillus sp. ISL-77]